MAHLTSNFTFTGSLSNLTAYKMRGSDKIVLRSKYGPSKDKVKHSPNYAMTRRINAEFGGRSTACKWIRQALGPQKVVADYNIAGPLNALLKPVQVLDTRSELGKRNVALSSQPHLLEGFQLNQRFPFDAIIRNPVAHMLSRDTLQATVTIPALLPGINFIVPGKQALYSCIAVLGIVPDLSYDGQKYIAHPGYNTLFPVVATTEWYAALSGSPVTTLTLTLPILPPDSSFSLMLSVGIRFGTVGEGGAIQQVPHAGSAKVLAMG